MTVASPSSECVTLAKESLHRLRLSLERSLGVQAASVLQDAGFASGEALARGFERWCASAYGVAPPQELDAHYLGQALSGFFESQGWGALTLDQLTPAVVLLEAPSWAESTPGRGQYPSCYVTAGLLADLFSRLAGGQFAAMEVECRSRGDGQCRFLMASPDTLTRLYEAMSHGIGYRQGLGLD